MAFVSSLPSSGPGEASHHIRQVLENGIKPEERDKRYDDFAVVYDEVLEKSNYNAPRVTAETVAEYLPENERGKMSILDIGAGTGLVGEELYKLGFRNIDGLEPSEGMISKLKEKQVYRKCICEAISSEPLDIPKGTYDVITVTGSHGPNHIESSAVLEMIRLVKSGGFIIMVTRSEHFVNLNEYKNTFFPLCDELEKNGKWKKKAVTKFPNYLSQIEGVKIVYQIC